MGTAALASRFGYLARSSVSGYPPRNGVNRTVYGPGRGTSIIRVKGPLKNFLEIALTHLRRLNQKRRLHPQICLNKSPNKSQKSSAFAKPTADKATMATTHEENEKETE
jgi:hypothetical protein